MEGSCLSVNRWCPEHCGSRSGLLSLVKRKNTAVAGIHCIIHKKAFASQMLPVALRSHLEMAVKMFYFIKGSALNTRFFRELCDNMDTQHQVLLFYSSTHIRWLSKGNMLIRLYALHECGLSWLSRERIRRC